MLSFLRFLYYTLSWELSQWKVTSADMPVKAVTRLSAMEISQPSLSFCAVSLFTNLCGCRRSTDHSLRTLFHSSRYLCVFTHLSACDKSPQCQQLNTALTGSLLAPKGEERKHFLSSAQALAPEAAVKSQLSCMPTWRTSLGRTCF